MFARWTVLASFGALIPGLLDISGAFRFVEPVWWRSPERFLTTGHRRMVCNDGIFRKFKEFVSNPRCLKSNFLCLK